MSDPTYDNLIKYWKDHGFTDEQCEECTVLVRDLAIEFTQYAMHKRQLEILNSFDMSEPIDIHPYDLYELLYQTEFVYLGGELFNVDGVIYRQTTSVPPKSDVIT
jgi:hypothetical protein